jgi:hypothetical protein
MPWLGNVGLIVTAVVFCSGSVSVAYGVYQEENFLAPGRQLIGTAIASVLLIPVALRLPARRFERVQKDASGPWLCC